MLLIIIWREKTDMDAYQLKIKMKCQLLQFYHFLRHRQLHHNPSAIMTKGGVVIPQQRP
jgi:hypothetical protein